MTDDDKGPPLELVSNRSDAGIAEERARYSAEASMRKCLVNVLRVVAGAGEPGSVIGDMANAVKAWVEFREAHKAATGTAWGTPTPGLFTVDDLFDRERLPETEEEWRKWAVRDPVGDFHEKRDRIVSRLRVSVLREIAGTVSGHPTLPQYRSEVKNAFRDYEDAVETLRKDRGRPPRIDPIRQRQANEGIADIREKQLDDMIAGLTADRLAALAAVRSGDPAGFEPFDAFIFDVLARMGLLKRKPRGKSKRDWDLTDVGNLALDRHGKGHDNAHKPAH